MFKSTVRAGILSYKSILGHPTVNRIARKLWIYQKSRSISVCDGSHNAVDFGRIFPVYQGNLSSDSEETQSERSAVFCHSTRQRPATSNTTAPSRGVGEPRTEIRKYAVSHCSKIYLSVLRRRFRTRPSIDFSEDSIQDGDVWGLLCSAGRLLVCLII